MKPSTLFLFAVLLIGHEANAVVTYTKTCPLEEFDPEFCMTTLNVDVQPVVS